MCKDIMAANSAIDHVDLHSFITLVELGMNSISGCQSCVSDGAQWGPDVRTHGNVGSALSSM